MSTSDGELPAGWREGYEAGTEAGFGRGFRRGLIIGLLGILAELALLLWSPRV